MDNTYLEILKVLTRPRMKPSKFGPLPPPPEHVRKCPLCKSDIKMFFVDEFVAVLNCENEICPFPYGYEDLQFIEHKEVEFADVSTTQNTHKSGSSSTTEKSDTWSEIEKHSALLSDNDEFDETPKQKGKKSDSKKSKMVKRQKTVEDIKELNEELYNMKQKEQVITDPKIINSLIKLQQVCGNSILKPKEVELINEYKSKQFGNNFKINIEQDPSNISTIKIDFTK